MLGLSNLLGFNKRQDRIIEHLTSYLLNQAGLQGSIKLSKVMTYDNYAYRHLQKDIVVNDLNLLKDKEAYDLFRRIDKEFPVTIVVGESAKHLQGHGFKGSLKSTLIYLGGYLSDINNFKG